MNQLFQWLADLVRGARPWVMVLAWERGVLVRFGKHTRVLEPGMHWRIPYLDAVRLFNNRLRITAFPSVTVAMSDGRVMAAAGNIGFRIIDPRAALLAMSSPERILGAIAQTSVAEVLSCSPPATLTVLAVEAAATQALRDFVNDRGVEVDFVRLMDFTPVRPIRLLQEQWRPESAEDTHA